MTRPSLLVDSASLYFRAFFGIPESAAKAPNGMPVNAVRGFLDMVATLIRTRKPDRLVCALDEDWRPAWRVALLPAYKSQRVAPAGGELIPDALAPQVPVILEFLAALGIVAAGEANYEADDVIGTLAGREPGPIEVATGDRDLFQVIDDDREVTVLFCGRGVANLEVMDAGALLTRCGVLPSAYADFAALRGDASDGLPGVAGIGEKTAARLIDRYGGLDGILGALDDPKAGFAPGVRAKLIAGRDYLDAARKVVLVAPDVPVKPQDFALPAAPVDPERLIALAEEWNLAGATKRIVDAMAAPR